jgi:hypothetical protein
MAKYAIILLVGQLLSVNNVIPQKPDHTLSLVGLFLFMKLSICEQCGEPFDFTEYSLCNDCRYDHRFIKLRKDDEVNTQNKSRQDGKDEESI